MHMEDHAPVGLADFANKVRSQIGSCC